MRINKYLTEANYCSRRQADELVKQGKVQIGKRTAQLGDQVEAGDEVKVNGKLIGLQEKKVYLAYYKPVGVITTTDRRAKDNIIYHVDYPVRVYPIGRLDVNTSGIILLTNDGSVVNKILKSKNQVEKEYEIVTQKAIPDQDLQKLATGIVLDGRKTLPGKCYRISDNKFGLIITEGRNRQIRRMLDKLGYEATRLKRIRIGNLSIENLELESGKYVELKAEQIDGLVKNKQVR